MKIEEMIKKEPYRSIIELTQSYENPYTKKGLSRMHYRWALIQNHDNIKGTYFKEKMAKFFRSAPCNDKDEKELLHKEHYNARKKYYLEFLYELGIIERDVIRGKRANNNLGNFLKRLVDIGILVTHGDSDKIMHYTLTEKYAFLAVCYSLSKKVSDFALTVGNEVTDKDIQQLRGFLQGEIDFIDSGIKKEN